MTIVNFNNFKTEMLPSCDVVKGSKYLNLGSGFDIETTKINENKTFMYIWQWSLNDLVIYGRTWEEFKQFKSILSTHYELNNDKRLLCYIHNASYEFQFMKKQVKFHYDEKHKSLEVFAVEPRKIVYFTTDDFVEFRDSLILTQKPLKDLPKTYGLKTQKTNDLDYTLTRTSETELTEKELQYCVNDVLILSEFFHKYIKREFLAKQIKIPLTSTGIVRNELKRHFKKLDKDVRKKHKNRLMKAYPNEKEYIDIFRWVFRGGFVHANIVVTNETLINQSIGSQDFKSSYPAVLLHEKFPFRFCKKNSSFFERIKNDRKYLQNNAFYGCFKFTEIRAKYEHSIESISKLVKYDKQSLIHDNGRLVYCKEIIVCLTEQDWLNYDDFYNFETVECLNDLRVSSKESLPTWFKDLILKYFYLKETLPKDSTDYKLSKAKLNSLYGMCVSGLINTTLCFDGTEMTISDKQQEFWKITQKEILNPFWGVWCTAYARRNLLHYGFLPFCKADSSNQAWYGDTDSIKYSNTIANQYIFNNYNDRIYRMNKTMYVGDYSRKLFMNIGIFDLEDKTYKFKTLGAKRYIHSDCVKCNDGKYRLKEVVTIAGCVKGSLQEYCKKENLDIYEVFKDNMKLDKINSKKKTTTYNDVGFSEVVTDCQGNTTIVNELSCVTINDIEFTMNMKPYYMNLIIKLKEKNKRRIGERTW